MYTKQCPHCGAGMDIEYQGNCYNCGKSTEIEIPTFNLDDAIESYMFNEDDESYLDMEPEQINRMLADVAYKAVEAYKQFLKE